VITGDLNRDRFKKEEKGGKVLCDLERINSDHNQPNAGACFNDEQT